PAMLGAFADGVDAGDAGFEMVVHRNAAIDLKPGRPRQLGVRPDAGRDDHRVRRDDGAVPQFDRLDATVADDARGLSLEPHGDALGFARAFEHACRALIELALHEPVHEMKYGDVSARLG